MGRMGSAADIKGEEKGMMEKECIGLQKRQQTTCIADEADYYLRSVVFQSAAYAYWA